jgi:hypothetical protein
MVCVCQFVVKVILLIQPIISAINAIQIVKYAIVQLDGIMDVTYAKLDIGCMMVMGFVMKYVQ